MKKKLATALLVILMMVGIGTAYARVEWGYWVDYPDGRSELIDPANLKHADWDDRELGDESIPLYALCGLAAIAAVGVVVMHRKRQRVG